MTENKYCCKDWEEAKKEIDGVYQFAWIHGQRFSGDNQFRYCPYCKEELNTSCNKKALEAGATKA